MKVIRASQADIFDISPAGRSCLTLRSSVSLSGLRLCARPGHCHAGESTFQGDLLLRYNSSVGRVLRETRDGGASRHPLRLFPHLFAPYVALTGIYTGSDDGYPFSGLEVRPGTWMTKSASGSLPDGREILGAGPPCQRLAVSSILHVAPGL